MSSVLKGVCVPDLLNFWNLQIKKSKTCNFEDDHWKLKHMKFWEIDILKTQTFGKREIGTCKFRNSKLVALRVLILKFGISKYGISKT